MNIYFACGGDQNSKWTKIKQIWLTGQFNVCCFTVNRHHRHDNGDDSNNCNDNNNIKEQQQ